MVDGLVAKVERREVPRPTSLGARGALPREVGTLIPPPGVLRHCTLAPPAAPSPRLGSRGKWQTSDALRRENAEAWLFEIESPVSCPGRDAARSSCEALL